jgi:hypothetical protein
MSPLRGHWGWVSYLALPGLMCLFMFGVWLIVRGAVGVFGGSRPKSQGRRR